MKLIKRILGICETPVPGNPDAWNHDNGVVSVNLKLVPEISSPGSAVRLEGKGLPERILLIHSQNGQYTACKNRCTHMGRRLDPVDGAGKIECCSVSTSTFELSGERISGPAKKSLTAYPVEATDRELTIRIK